MTESVKNTTDTTDTTELSMSHKKQKGGFLLDLLFGKKKARQPQTKKAGKSVLGASKDSEDKLIKSYESLASVSKKYYEDYNKHLENLITLDDINGMTGLQATFKNVIVKNLFKGYDKVDQSSPMLLKNYSVTENTTPKFFRKEHLISQIRYKLASFALKDTLLISQYDVSMEDNKAVIKFKMINGDKHEKTVAIDSDFNMDLSKLQSDLREVIKSMKKKMDYEIEIADDFELTEADLEIPGLEFADPGTALERKIKALQPSVKVDSAELATAKPKIASAKKDVPAWTPFKQPRITQSAVKGAPTQGQKTRHDGKTTSFKPDTQPGHLDKGAADKEQALQDLLETKPQLPQATKDHGRPAREQGQMDGQNKQRAPGQNKQREPRPVDPLQEKCAKFTTKDECNNNKCYFAKNNKCYPPIKK
jgi:hypothetical protein